MKRSVIPFEGGESQPRNEFALFPEGIGMAGLLHPNRCFSMIRFFLTLFALSGAAISAHAQFSPAAGFFKLSYRVVGVHPETQIPYQGFCRIEKDGEGGHIMTRIIDGKTDVAIFVVEEGKDHERNPEMRIIATLVDGEDAYEIFYSFQNSTDNHPLLTGDIRKVGGRKSYAKGFEMLRPITATHDLHASLEEELLKVETGVLPREKGDPERLLRLLKIIPKKNASGQE